MKKFFIAAFVLMSVLITFTVDSYALESVLYFSDITSGPKTGNTDGKGNGAIVSVWGVNLGASQGASKIYVGGVPASYIYYWGNADTKGASGPADLYSYHKMQTISFAVSSSAVDGAGEIYAVVDGKKTNSLPFTVRSGKIHFVKTTGADSTSSTGAWTSPFKTLSYAALGTGNLGGGGKVAPGDIIYATDGVTESSGLPIKYIMGTAAMPLAIVAYPGAAVQVLGPSGWGIGNHNHASAYWNFSKLTVKTQGTGLDTFKGMRAIGNEIMNYPGGCANGQSGAIAGNNLNDPTSDIVGGNIKIFGNYVHDYGCDTTSKLHHVFYISNRGGYAVEAFELGWNYVRDNKVHHALHVYDEGVCGDFSGTLRIHDNVVKNQVGVGVGIGSTISGTCFTMPVEIYNNLFINIGQEIAGDTDHNYGIGIGDAGTKSYVKIYNNTFYGYGQTGSPTSYLLNVTFGGTYEFVDNIIVDTTNSPYLASGTKAPAASSGNIWYNGGDSTPAAPPSWNSTANTSDPMFVDPANGYFNPKASSPALTGGADTTAVAARDFRGIKRGLGKPVTIGAFEFIETLPPAPPKSLIVN